MGRAGHSKETLHSLSPRAAASASYDEQAAPPLMSPPAQWPSRQRAGVAQLYFRQRTRSDSTRLWTAGRRHSVILRATSGAAGRLLWTAGRRHSVILIAPGNGRPIRLWTAGRRHSVILCVPFAGAARLVVDSGQASLSYTDHHLAQGGQGVVDSGQASLSYTSDRGHEVLLLVVDSGQASLSYTDSRIGACQLELWTAGRRRSVILAVQVHGVARSCGQRAGVAQLYCRTARSS